MDESESGIMMAKRTRLARSLTTIEAHIIHDALAATGIKSRIRRKFASAALSPPQTATGVMHCGRAGWNRTSRSARKRESKPA